MGPRDAVAGRFGRFGGTASRGAVVDPSGTIYETFHDSLGRLTTVRVGTDNSASSSNMVALQENVYDANGLPSVGG